MKLICFNLQLSKIRFKLFINNNNNLLNSLSYHQFDCICWGALDSLDTGSSMNELLDVKMLSVEAVDAVGGVGGAGGVGAEGALSAWVGVLEILQLVPS
jgi:hypothetical protein